MSAAWTRAEKRTGASPTKEVWLVCQQQGVRENGARIQYLTDGEEELEHVHQMLFKGWPNATRTLDAMHACGYVDTLCKLLAPDPGAADKASCALRRKLVEQGWSGYEKAFRRRFAPTPPETLSGDAAKAWNYLSKRSHQMDYPECRRRHLSIGSGMLESGCKNIFAARFEGPGMRWRFANGLGLATLRAQLKSGLPIIA